jgi:hypothetical protein
MTPTDAELTRAEYSPEQLEQVAPVEIVEQVAPVEIVEPLGVNESHDFAEEEDSNA